MRPLDPFSDTIGPILGLDAAALMASLALRLPDGRLLSRVIEIGRDSDEFLPTLYGLLEETHLSFTSLARIVVTLGPGSFTGLRLAIATAKGIALVHRIPVLGMNNFFVTEAALPSNHTGHRLIILESKREELFYQFFDAEHQPLGSPGFATLAQLTDMVAPLPQAGSEAPLLLIAGSGAHHLDDFWRSNERNFPHVRFSLSPSEPAAAILVRLAAARTRTVSFATSIEPYYLRPADIGAPKSHSIGLDG